MKNLTNKIVYITGASSGIGEACAKIFAAQGCRLILSARRVDKIKELANLLTEKYSVDVKYFQLDVTNKEQVKSTFEQLPDEWKNVDILINNAGLAIGMTEFFNDEIDNWDPMIDTNVKGVLYVTRTIVNSMIKNGSGHIINLGSIAGHEAYPKGAVYCATKHAIAAITKSLRMDLIDKGIKVSTIDPGMVETDFSNIRFKGDKEKAKNVYKGLNPLVADDIAESILFIATRPDHVNINEMIIMPNVQANAFITYRDPNKL